VCPSLDDHHFRSNHVTQQQQQQQTIAVLYQEALLRRFEWRMEKMPRTDRTLQTLCFHFALTQFCTNKEAEIGYELPFRPLLLDNDRLATVSSGQSLFADFAGPYLIVQFAHLYKSIW
jgi:hypothetical protein